MQGSFTRATPLCIDLGLWPKAVKITFPAMYLLAMPHNCLLTNLPDRKNGATPSVDQDGVLALADRDRCCLSRLCQHSHCLIISRNLVR